MRNQVKVKDFIGNQKYSDINEFVLPGGVIGNKGVRWTHTPEFDIGVELLFSAHYDELNGYFTPHGVPPVGRPGGVFLVSRIDGREVLVPYVQRGNSETSEMRSGDAQITATVDGKTGMLDIAASPAIDYGVLVSAIRQANDEK